MQRVERAKKKTSEPVDSLVTEKSLTYCEIVVQLATPANFAMFYNGTSGVEAPAPFALINNFRRSG